jgi:hypothetical protein
MSPRPSLALLLLAACQPTPDKAAPAPSAGTADSGTTADTDDGPCTATVARSRPPLRRLSHAQLRWTLHDLFYERMVAVEPDAAEWIAWWLEHELVALVPADVPTGAPGQARGGLRRLDQLVHAEHVEGMLQIGEELATTWGFGSSWRAQRLVGETCDLYADADCVETWVRLQGQALHRRPLSEAQVADYLSIFAEAAADVDPDSEDAGWAGWELGFHHVFVAMVAAPGFGYHLELGAGDETALDAWELASRLSYHFWQAPPDAALLAAAADGSLLTDAVYRAQVERLVADPKTERALREFAEDLFRTHELPRMDTRVGTEPFDSFLGETAVSATLHEAMAEELVALTVHHSLRAPGPLDDLLLSDRNPNQDTVLAAIYGEEPWSGDGEVPALADPRRHGLLTRAALLATGSANTRPIHKGVFLREGLLCEAIPPPPDNAAASPPELAEDATTREVVETLTEQPDSDCIVCHGSLINPLGFATEDFDALGRHRTEQALFDEWGNALGSRPVDTSGTTSIAGQAVSFTDVADLTHAVVASGAAHRCVARELFRFTAGRAEDEGDTCTVQQLGAVLEEGESLDRFLVRLALEPWFRSRDPHTPEARR